MNTMQLLSKAIVFVSGIVFSLSGFAQIQQISHLAPTVLETHVSRTAPDPFEYVDGLTEPQALNYRAVATTIEYPREAVDAGIEGSVMIRVLVDGQGAYVKHFVTASPDPSLTEAVNQQIHLLAFEPGHMQGQPVSGWVSTRFSFRLEE